MVKLLTVGCDLDRDRAFALHNACFGDGREWFNAFLCAAEGQGYIAFCEGEEYIGGMFLLDVFFDGYKGKYVYALGTMPAHRGKGIARALLEKAKELSADFTLICAADKKLAATYEKCGFDRYVGGIVPVGAEEGVESYGHFDTPCAYADIQSGLVLNEKLFEFALFECRAKLYTDGKAIVAKHGNDIYAVFNYLPDTFIAKKAQIHLKTNADLGGLLADLILEIS